MIRPQPARILIVDDNRVNRRVLEARLSGEGYEPRTVESAKDALEVFAESRVEALPVDLILLDIMMPEMDGMEFLQIIRRRYSALQLPIIMVTAKDQSADVVAALRAHANDYVTKPIDFEVLLSRMETHLALQQTHAALTEAQDALVQAGKLESVGFLAAGVAHEIRNPLAQLQMGLEAIRHLKSKPEGTNDELEPLLEAMADAVRQANSIVTDLLTYAEANRLNVEPTDLNRVVASALGLVDREMTAHAVTPILELAEDGLETLAAKAELRQVIVNVLLNAIQAMPNGGRLTVRTGERVVEGLSHRPGTRSGSHLRNGDRAACIEILDSGPGISENDLSRIYDPFFTSKPTGQGTGLGLTVARQLIELQGGLIEVSNRQDGNEGVCVRLFLKRETKLRVI